MNMVIIYHIYDNIALVISAAAQAVIRKELSSMLKPVIIFLLLAGWSWPARGGPPSEETIVNQGIRQLQQAINHWQADAFDQAAKLFNEAASTSDQDSRVYYWLGVTYYYKASYYLYARPQDRVEAEGKQAVNLGIEALKKAVHLAPDESETHALLGVLQGMMIQMNPWSALSAGPQVEQHRKQALHLNPDNPRVHYLTGLSLYMTPQLFGGSRDLALQHLLTAQTLFEKERTNSPEPLEPRWGYDMDLAFIGEIYYKQNQIKEAYRYYQKALLVNPHNLKALQGLEQLHFEK